MLTPARGALSRADLLRTLVLAGDKEEAPRSQRWAAALGYLHDPQALPPATPPISPPDKPISDDARPSNSPRSAARHPPLTAPLFAITACEPVAEADADADAAMPQATAAVAGLKPADCAPREPGGQPLFQPLVRPGKLWPRLKRAASQSRSNRRLDLSRLLQCLAHGKNLIRLPRRVESHLTTASGSANSNPRGN